MKKEKSDRVIFLLTKLKQIRKTYNSLFDNLGYCTNISLESQLAGKEKKLLISLARILGDREKIYDVVNSKFYNELIVSVDPKATKVDKSSRNCGTYKRDLNKQVTLAFNSEGSNTLYDEEY